MKIVIIWVEYFIGYLVYFIFFLYINFFIKCMIKNIGRFMVFIIENIRKMDNLIFSNVFFFIWYKEKFLDFYLILIFFGLYFVFNW